MDSYWVEISAVSSPSINAVEYTKTGFSVESIFLTVTTPSVVGVTIVSVIGPLVASTR